MIERLSFVTSNANKIQQVRNVLGNEVEHIEFEVPEYQSFYLADIVEQKAFDVYRAYERPVLVDDTSLIISALGGWPGPFVKHFLEKVGVEGILRMLNGVTDRKAWANVIFGLHDGTEVQLFQGVEMGEISEYPRGENGFGFDSIFVPEGFTKTRAEMEGEEFDLTSPRFKALVALQKHLSS